MFKEKILKAVESSITPLGYEVIDIELENKGLIRIFIDVLDGSREVNLEDCELITKQLVYLLPVEEINFERLEVSSPGVDRRLTKLHHFDRFVGSIVKLRFRDSIQGKKNFIGCLKKHKLENNMNIDFKSDCDDLHKSNKNFGDCFYIEDYINDRVHKIEFALEQIEQARLVEDVSVKGKNS